MAYGSQSFLNGGKITEYRGLRVAWYKILVVWFEFVTLVKLHLGNF